MTPDLPDCFKRTNLQRAKRIAEIARTIPTAWSDSERWPEVDLDSIEGVIHARYRVNLPGRFLIVLAMSGRLSFEMLEQQGIADATSFFRIAVASLLGPEFPDVANEEHAAEVLRLNQEFAAGASGMSLDIEAVYVDGKCERTSREFQLEDWFEDSGEVRAESGARTEPAQEPVSWTEPIPKAFLRSQLNCSDKSLAATLLENAMVLHPSDSLPNSKHKIRLAKDSLINTAFYSDIGRAEAIAKWKNRNK